MDMKKIILYVALAFVAMTLWNSWKQEHQPKQVATNTTTKQQVVTKSQTDTSVPVLSSQQPVKTEKEIPVSRIVTVKTDVLNLKIDTLGGTIISAKLPKYSAKVKTPNIPVQILSAKNKNLYVAQSGLLGIQQKPLLYKVSQKSFSLNGQEKIKVDLTYKGNGFSVIKSFIVTKGSYAVDVNYQVKNQSGKAFKGQVFAQLKRRQQPQKGSFFSIHTYDGAAVFNPHKTSNYDKISYKDMDEAALNLDTKGGWAAMQQRYFLSAWIPNQDQTNHYYSHTDGDNVYAIGTTSAINIAAGQQQDINMKLYVGPEIAANLKPLAKGLYLTIDYGWLWPISIAIFWLMQLINGFICNWGWTIVIITILIKLVFYKLSNTGYKASAKMRELGPKMKALKERYGDDRQAMSKATMELYKKEKINPISGCLPMLVQIPFFIALYYVLIEAVQLRHAPFIFWITDLSVKDPYFILPILMGVSMFFTTKLSPTSLDPAQAKMMLIMPVVFTVLFASFPAGLVLYWLVNNLASLLQQWYVMRKYSHQKA